MRRDAGRNKIAEGAGQGPSQVGSLAQDVSSIRVLSRTLSMRDEHCCSYSPCSLQLLLMLLPLTF